jgi:hypothetical protein
VQRRNPVAATGPNGPIPKTGWGDPMPAGAWVMTSPFGWRMHPVVHTMKLHTGDDLAAPERHARLRRRGGTVKWAAPNDGYGNQVVVAHGGGADSAYNHLSVILAKVGQKVKAGPACRQGRHDRHVHRQPPALRDQARWQADRPGAVHEGPRREAGREVSADAAPDTFHSLIMQGLRSATRGSPLGGRASSPCGTRGWRPPDIARELQREAREAGRYRA